MNWRVGWTTDNDSWQERWFETLEEARAFGNELVSKNGDNRDFWMCAQRRCQCLCIVNTSDFIDYSVPAEAIKLA